MRKLDQKIVVLTGASSGIGRATALAFAKKGAALLLTARRQEALDALAEECRQLGAADAIGVAADVAAADETEELARRAVATFGRLDVWVNNAAVNAYGRLEELPVADWHRVIETNLLGSYHGARAALPWFREQGGGVLVNVSSALGKIPSPYQSAYVASKHGIVALSDCVRQEVTDVEGLHVCTVLPGPVDTPLFEQASNYTGWHVKPMQPMVDPRRVARAIVRCATRPRPEVSVGASALGAGLGSRLSPRLTERVAEVQVEADHFQNELATVQPGNLDEPSRTSSSVFGGWRDGDGSVGRKLATAGLAGAVTVAAVKRARRG